MYGFEVYALMGFIAGLVVGGGVASLVWWGWFLKKVQRLEVL